MKLFILISVTCLLSVVSCTVKETKQVRSLIAFDSLAQVQIQALTESGAQLTKVVTMNTTRDSTTFTPKDSLAWANELEIFQQISTINKPGNRDYYQDTLQDDSTSNLSIRNLTTDKNLVLKKVSIYYLESAGEIKKIEALTNDKNSLYKSARSLSLNFSRVSNKTLLTSYSIYGGQHMILGDTVQFEIQGTIRFK